MSLSVFGLAPAEVRDVPVKALVQAVTLSLKLSETGLRKITLILADIQAVNKL